MKVLFIAFLLVLTSCASQKVSFSVNIKYPYCGGAKPTPVMQKGRLEPADSMRFGIIREGELEVSQWLTLDSEGKWDGKLKAGNYFIFREDKTLTIEEIIKKHKLESSEMYNFKGEKCLELWKKEADYSFTIQENNDNKISFDLQSKCYVGLKPCLEYIGPKVN